MKKNIHPEYNEIEVEMTNGTKFKTKSTLKAKSLKLDIDPFTHPAWVGGSTFINDKANTVADFNKKFGNIFKIKTN